MRIFEVDVAATIGLARVAYQKMIQNLLWTTDYNTVAIPLSPGVLYKSHGIVINPTFGAMLMAGSTISAPSMRACSSSRDERPELSPCLVIS